MPKDERSRRIKQGLAKSDKTLGRPREFDYQKITSLRLKKLSMRKIMKIVGCSIGTVQAAIKSAEITTKGKA